MNISTSGRARARNLLCAVAAGLFLAITAGCAAVDQGIPDPAAEGPGTAATAAPNTTALKPLDELLTIPVKGRAPKTGYSRDQFGQAWADVDRNGCDTRNDVLGRDLHGTNFKAGTSDCVVVSGTLSEPYTGKDIAFQRGSGSAAVQIDHVVPLSDAWQKGAQAWDADKRLQFANDPENLLAVDGPANMQKGDGDLATWLPPNTGYRCTYAAKIVHIKAKYGLWMTQAEQAAARRILSKCN